MRRLAEANALLAAQRAALSGGDHVRREVEPWIDATPAERPRRVRGPVPRLGRLALPLVPLPEEAWALIEVYPLDDGSGVALDVPIWTNEGRSDLTLQLTASERDGAVAIQIDDLHVL